MALLAGGQALQASAARPPARVSQSSLIWGMGDQQPNFFSDARWQQLPLLHVRYFLPWDLVHEAHYKRLADRWMAIARSHHAIPLIAVKESSIMGRTRYLPTVAEYKKAVGAIMRRYSWVKEWTPWNEANLNTQSTLKHPEVAAAYWSAMHGLCGSCTVTSPSIVGYNKMPQTWIPAFLRAAHGFNGPWALHLYNDINELHPYALTAILPQLPSGAPIWVTEVGAWVHFNGFPTNIARQTQVLTYLFQLAASQPRISRWYLYQWRGSFPGAHWDSGLVELSGKARPGLRVVQHHLLAPGVKPIK